MATAPSVTPDELERQRKWAFTKEVLLHSKMGRVVKTTGSLYNWAQTYLNLAQRAFLAYLGTLEDPNLKFDRFDLFPDVTAGSNYKLLEKYWNSESAKELRYHDLESANAMLRGLYAFSEVGESIMKHSMDEHTVIPASAWSPATGSGLWRSKTALDRLKDSYDSPEADAFAKSAAGSAMDLGLSFWLDAYNPIFKIMQSGKGLIRSNYIKSQINKINPNWSQDQVRDFLKFHFERGSLEPSVVDSVHSALHPEVFTKTEASSAASPKQKDIAAAVPNLIENAKALAQEIYLAFEKDVVSFFGVKPPPEIMQAAFNHALGKGIELGAQRAGHPLPKEQGEAVSALARKIFNWEQTLEPGGKEINPLGILDSTELEKIERVASDFAFKKLQPGMGAVGSATKYVRKFEPGFVDEDSVYRTLHAVGFQKPGPISESSVPFKWFRSAGASASPAEQTILSKFEDHMRAYNKRVDATMKDSKPLQDFLKEGTSNELLQFTRLAYEGKPMNQITQEVMEGTRPVITPRALEAYNEFKRVAKGEWVQRADFWSTLEGVRMRNGRVAKALEKIGKLSGKANELKGDIAKAQQSIEMAKSINDKTELVAWTKILERHQNELSELKNTTSSDVEKLKEYIKRNRNDQAPPWLSNYWMRIADEDFAGIKLPGWETRWRGELFPKAAKGDIDKYMESSAKLGDDTLRKVWANKLGGLVKRPASEAREFAYKDLVDNINKEVNLIPSASLEEYGSKENRDRVLNGLNELKEMVERAQDPQEKSFVMRMINTMVRYSKEAGLFLPAMAWQAFTAFDNVARNVVAFGPNKSFRIPPMTSKIGTELSFSKQLAAEALREPSGARSIFELPILKQYKEGYLDPVNAKINKWSRDVPGAWLYHAKDAELEKTILQGELTAKEYNAQIHRIAYRSAMDDLSKVQYGMEPTAPAIEWLEKVGAFAPVAGYNSFKFANFWWQTLKTWMRLAAENPRPVHAIMTAREKLAEMSMGGGGQLNVPGTNLQINPITLSTFDGLARMAEKTQAPGLDPKSPANTALSILRSADSGAAAFLKQAQYVPQMERTLTGAQAMYGDNVPMKRGDGAMEKIPGELYGLNSIMKALTGHDLYQYATYSGNPDLSQSKEDQRVRNGANLQLKAAILNGENITKEEAENRFFQSQRDEGMLSLLGLSGTNDPNAMVGHIKNAVDTMRSMPYYDQRLQFYNSMHIRGPNGDEPLFRGIASPKMTYDGHPDADFIKRFDAVKEDPKKTRELMHDSTLRQRNGIFQNLMDWFHNTHLKNPFESEAHGGEYHGAAPDPDRFEKSLPDKNARNAVMKTGVPVAADQFQFLTDEAMHGGLKHGGMASLKAGEPTGENYDPELARRAGNLNASMNQAVRGMASRWAEAHTPQQYRDAFVKPFSVLDMDGNKTTVDPVRVFGINPRSQINSDSLLYRTLLAGHMGGVDANKQPVKYDNTIFGEARDFLATGTIPYRITKGEADRNKANGLELRPFQKRIEMSVAMPERYPPGLEERKLRDEMSAGGPGAPPHDLYRKLVEADPANYVTLAKFALAADFSYEKHAGLQGLMYVPDYRGRQNFSEKMIDSMIAGGMLHEVQLIGLTDKNVDQYLTSLGHKPEAEELAKESLVRFSARNGLNLGEKDVARGGGIVPHYVAGPGPSTLPMAAPTVTGGPAPGVSTSTAPAVPLIPVGTPAGKTPISFPEAGTQSGPITMPDPYYRTDKLPAFEPPANVAKPRAWSIPQDLQMWSPPEHFKSVSEFVNFAARSTIDTNRRIDSFNVARDQDLGYTEPYHRLNFFTTAAHYLPSLDPETAAHGAAAVMTLGYHMGWVNPQELNEMHGGLNQANLIGLGQQAATSLLSMAGNHMAAMSNGERLAAMSADAAPLIEKAKEASDLAAQVALHQGAGSAAAQSASAQAATAQGMAAVAGHGAEATFAGYAGPIGGALSIAGGVLGASPSSSDRTTGKALSTAGGAAEGASLGMMVGGPWGAGIGAIAGGALGYFGSGSRTPEERQPNRAWEEQRRASMISQQARYEGGNLAGRSRAMNVGFATGRVSMQPHINQMMSYYRRPSYWTMTGNQGLVSRVESSIYRTLSPRW